MLPEFAQKYWQYEYDVAARHMIPLLERWGITLRGIRVLDVGCGEAGSLAAMADRGAHCSGFDIEAPRVEWARERVAPRAIRLAVGNLFSAPPFAAETFDLLILHDVFEHLDRKEEALGGLQGFLTPAGRILITFPYSAGSELVVKNNVEDPSIYVAQEISNIIKSKFNLKAITQSETLSESNEIDLLCKTYIKNEVLLDVRTLGWSFDTGAGSNPAFSAEYVVSFVISLKLIFDSCSDLL